MIFCLVRLDMNFLELMKVWDLALCLWLFAVNIAFVGLFLWGFSRRRKTVFLILAISSVCFAYVNAFFGLENLYGVIQVRLLPPPIMRALYLCYMGAGAIGSMCLLAGLVSLVRLVVCSVPPDDRSSTHEVFPP